MLPRELVKHFIAHRKAPYNGIRKLTNGQFSGAVPGTDHDERLLHSVVLASLVNVAKHTDLMVRILLPADDVFENFLYCRCNQALADGDNKKRDCAHDDNEALKRLLGHNVERQICGQQRRFLMVAVCIEVFRFISVNFVNWPVRSDLAARIVVVVVVVVRRHCVVCRRRKAEMSTLRRGYGTVDDGRLDIQERIAAVDIHKEAASKTSGDIADGGKTRRSSWQRNVKGSQITSDSATKALTRLNHLICYVDDDSAHNAQENSSLVAQRGKAICWRNAAFWMEPV